MTDMQKDISATIMTALAALVLLTTWQGWNVYLVGGSHRWAAGLVALLGSAACALGTRSEGGLGRFLMGLGLAALALAVLAIVTGSLAWLTALVAVMVVLWLVSTIEHASSRGTHRLAV